MKVTLTRKERRNVLTCVRADGSRTRADVGPGLPQHDLAHFVVEQRFALRGGFFGNVAAGYCLQALGEKEVIRSLGRESWKAEVLARALGSLATGACTAEQFTELVNTELAHHGIAPIAALDAPAIACLLGEFRELLDRYAALRHGESLELEFDQTLR